jgi:tetratricopeptide (TPR) repeat protein
MLVLMIWALLISQVAPEREALDKIRAALSQNDLKTAETVATETVRLYPDSPGGHFFLGGIRARQRRFEEAEAEFLKVLEIDEDFPDAYLVIGTLYEAQNRLDEALAILERGLRNLPENTAVRYQLGRLLVSQADFRRAISVLTRIPAEEAPVDYWDTLGQAYTLSGEINRAEESYSEYLEQRPNSVRTLHTLSAIALKRNDTAKAWEHIAQARRLAPNSPQILLDFAYISMAENLVGEAAAALQFLLLMQPNNTDAIFELGSAFIHFANFDSSGELFRQYVKLKPNDPMGHAMLGYVLFLSSQFDDARASLTRALEIDADLIDATFYLGMIEFSQARNDQAEQLFKAVLNRTQDHARAYLNLGKLYIRQRRLDEALTVLQKAVQLIPTNFEVHFQLSRVYAAMGDREKAAHSLKLFKKYQEEKETREQASRRTPYTQFYTGPQGQNKP